MGAVMGRAVSGYRRSSRNRVVEKKTPVLARPAVVFAVVLLFAAAMVSLVQPEEPAGPTSAVEEAGASFSLVLAAELIKKYRDEHGRLPESLAEVGLAEQQIRYRQVWDGSFELEATVGSEPVRYHSAEAPDELLQALGSSPDGAR